MSNQVTFSPRSFAVVGAGPVGCIVAAFLAKGGYEVTLCDVLPSLLKPALDPGIIIEGAESLQEKVTRTCTTIDELAQYKPDVIFITVKANALPLIASAIEGFQREGMYVISWQNGIDTELELAKVLRRDSIMRAVVNYGCGLAGPAHVKMPFHHPPHYIQELEAEAAPAAMAIAEALTNCGLTTAHTDQIISMVWRKGVLNACMNPVCAVTGLTMAQSMTDPIVFNIVDSLVKECIQVARSNEINLGWEFYPHAIEYMSNAGDHKPSMLMDIENNRRTEIDYINGKFVAYGKQAGIATPYNITLLSLVKGLESKQESG
ncbi:MAG: 2-dehydropantoate 2-reductase [Desulfobacterales bacterium]|nr:2-dehydropantoate 2-reductase [Desulfobacterales bacterium]